MDSFDAKALKRLADTCRKAGISNFKGYGVEFTLSDYIAPPKNSAISSQMDSPFEAEGALSDEDLMLWSTNDAHLQDADPETGN